MTRFLKRIAAKRRWRREVRDGVNAKVDEAYRRLLRGEGDE